MIYDKTRNKGSFIPIKRRNTDRIVKMVKPNGNRYVILNVWGYIRVM